MIGTQRCRGGGLGGAPVSLALCTLVLFVVAHAPRADAGRTASVKTQIELIAALKDNTVEHIEVSSPAGTRRPKIPSRPAGRPLGPMLHRKHALRSSVVLSIHTLIATRHTLCCAQMLASVVLTEAQWRKQTVPFVIRRNVTLASSPSLPHMASLYMAAGSGLYAKMRLANGVTMRYGHTNEIACCRPGNYRNSPLLPALPAGLDI